jgi:hypothetical protein
MIELPMPQPFERDIEDFNAALELPPAERAAYCLSVTLRKRLQAHAPGLTSRAVLETLSGILMLDVHVPLADGRELVMPRYTQPEAEHRLVLEKLGWELPPQPPPRIRRAQVPTPPKDPETNSKM